MPKDKQEVILLTESDLPLHCPTPQQTTWNMHPRVYLDIKKTGEAKCPYCGSEYRLNTDDTLVADNH